MKDFDQFISDNKDRVMSVTKLKNRNAPENHNSHDIALGESFVGQVQLKYFDESSFGSGFIILVDGGFTFNSSLVREVQKKSETKWLAKTLNSIYRIEVVK